VGFCGLVPMLLRGNAYNFHSNALYPRPLFRSAERVTFAQSRKSNQKVSLRFLMPAFLHSYMIVSYAPFIVRHRLFIG
jgi:hypothetical protein